MRRVMALPLTLLLAGAGLTAAGCSLVGFGIGAIADSRKKHPRAHAVGARGAQVALSVPF